MRISNALTYTQRIVTYVNSSDIKFNEQLNYKILYKI